VGGIGVGKGQQILCELAGSIGRQSLFASEDNDQRGWDDRTVLLDPESAFEPGIELFLGR
jgi:hypothetical protein